MPVAFDTSGMEQYDERTWFCPRTGDQVSLTYIDLVPDLPAPLDDLPLLRHRLALETAEIGALIEAHVVMIDSVPALYQLLKLPIPDRESGQAFIAAFTVPKATCSTVLRIQCAEGETTGTRESAVIASVGPEAFVRPHPYAPALEGRLPWHVGDEERWDSQFPDHPLTRARRWANRTIATARIDPAFADLPPFTPKGPGPNDHTDVHAPVERPALPPATSRDARPSRPSRDSRSDRDSRFSQVNGHKQSSGAHARPDPDPIDVPSLEAPALEESPSRRNGRAVPDSPSPARRSKLDSASAWQVPPSDPEPSADSPDSETIGTRASRTRRAAGSSGPTPSTPSTVPAGGEAGSRSSSPRLASREDLKVPPLEVPRSLSKGRSASDGSTDSPPRGLRAFPPAGAGDPTAQPPGALSPGSPARHGLREFPSTSGADLTPPAAGPASAPGDLTGLNRPDFPGGLPTRPGATSPAGPPDFPPGPGTDLTMPGRSDIPALGPGAPQPGFPSGPASSQGRPAPAGPGADPTMPARPFTGSRQPARQGLPDVPGRGTDLTMPGRTDVPSTDPAALPSFPAAGSPRLPDFPSAGRAAQQPGLSDFPAGPGADPTARGRPNPGAPDLPGAGPGAGQTAGPADFPAGPAARASGLSDFPAGPAGSPSPAAGLPDFSARPGAGPASPAGGLSDFPAGPGAGPPSPAGGLPDFPAGPNSPAGGPSDFPAGPASPAGGLPGFPGAGPSGAGRPGAPGDLARPALGPATAPEPGSPGAHRIVTPGEYPGASPNGIQSPFPGASPAFPGTADSGLDRRVTPPSASGFPSPDAFPGTSTGSANGHRSSPPDASQNPFIPPASPGAFPGGSPNPAGDAYPSLEASPNNRSGVFPAADPNGLPDPTRSGTFPAANGLPPNPSNRSGVFPATGDPNGLPDPTRSGTFPATSPDPNGLRPNPSNRSGVFPAASPDPNGFPPNPSNRSGVFPATGDPNGLPDPTRSGTFPAVSPSANGVPPGAVSPVSPGVPPNPAGNNRFPAAAPNAAGIGPNQSGTFPAAAPGVPPNARRPDLPGADAFPGYPAGSRIALPPGTTPDTGRPGFPDNSLESTNVHPPNYAPSLPMARPTASAGAYPPASAAPIGSPQPMGIQPPMPPAGPGDVMHTVLIGLPIGGYLPLWHNDSVTYWRMADPTGIRTRLGTGIESRTEIDNRRFREAALFAPDGNKLFLMDRFRNDAGNLGGASTQLIPATKEEAFRAADDKAMSDFYSWIGDIVVAAGQRGEYVAIETGGWHVPVTPVVLIMLRTDGREWHSVVETSPVPVGAPVWRDQQPVDGDTQLLASPATDRTMRAAGLLTRFAVATWPMHPFQLGLSFGPNPTLGDVATR